MLWAACGRLEHVRNRGVRGERDCNVRDHQAERASGEQKCAERQSGERQRKWQRNREVEIAERIAGDDRDCDRVDWRDALDAG